MLYAMASLVPCWTGSATTGWGVRRYRQEHRCPRGGPPRLNDRAKSAWGRAPGQEPPYARAEATPLPVLAQRLGFDLDSALTALRAADIAVENPRTNLETLARTNGTTPAALFTLIPSTAPSRADSGEPLDPSQIEDRLTGTGVGGKSLAAFAEANGLDAETARARLAANGLEAESDETLKAFAERCSTQPIEVAKLLLAPAYRLPSAPVTSPSH